MLPKLMTLPIASAIASASSPLPVLRIAARTIKTRKQHEERNHGELAQGEQPGDADGGDGGQLQMIADEQSDRDVLPLIERRGSATP